MRTIWLSLTVSMVGGCQLIGQNCTKMYAPDGVSVDLIADTWAPGSYELQVNGELCFVTLPGGDDLNCSDPLQLFLDPDGTRIESLSLWEITPSVVDIVLLRDGETIDAVSVEPVYELSEPNGKGCGETSWAEESVDIDPS
jgi:hypothetical protein